MTHKNPPKMKRFGRLAMVPANKNYQFQSQLNQRCVLALLCNTSAQKKQKKKNMLPGTYCNFVTEEWLEQLVEKARHIHGISVRKIVVPATQISDK